MIPKKESNVVEFKQNLDDSVIETLVAFSNAKGGVVYVGVTDKGSVCGVTLGKETIPKLLNKIKHITFPAIMPNADVLEIEGKRVLVLSVDDYPLKPVSIQGIYYKRVDASDHKLSSEEIANMNLQTMNASWDMFTNSFHSMDDISMEKVQKSMDLLRKNSMTIDESILPFMEKYNLLREGKTTNAAYLLYKHDHSDFTTIELGRFQDEITIKDSAS